jgi:flavin reductase (DIM6/NTAB) family NADH-FMN oxidoreductase RutF
MGHDDESRPVALEVEGDFWERFFTVAPLVVVGTREADGTVDLAPKHMVTPLSWGPHFGFVCTPSHRTYVNAAREGVFTISFPRPDQVVLASLAAAPRGGGDDKPSLAALPTRPATKVDGELLENAYLWLECELDRVVDGFGDNSLVAGRVVAAAADAASLRDPDVDDQDLLRRAPLLAYLPPGRFATVAESRAFPFHAGFRR